MNCQIFNSQSWNCINVKEKCILHCKLYTVKSAQVIPFRLAYLTKDIQSNNNNTIVLSMLYAGKCPKVRRHNALFGSCIMPSNLGTYFGIALCLLTLGHISAYKMDNTILLYK
jgi:hypothetical protein